MILIKYSKLNGAEFISHLDTLRHLQKIIRRTGINVRYSNGFNPHMLCFMSSPIPLGMKSESEFLLIDTPDSADGFKQLFNLKSPKGIKCVDAYNTEKKVNVVNDVDSAIYEIEGLNYFDVNEILNLESFIVADKKKGEKEARDKILSLKWHNGKLICRFKFGNDNLRPDVFIEKVKSIYGGNHVTVIKKDVTFIGGKTVTEYLGIE
jgi:radical SAM-linked protein